jgi:hypothetical protein
MSQVFMATSSPTTKAKSPWRLIALWGGLSLGWEIFLALMLKLALVIGIKMAFFSDPVPKAVVAGEIANVFSNAPVASESPQPAKIETKLKESE